MSPVDGVTINLCWGKTHGFALHTLEQEDSQGLEDIRAA